MTRTGWRSLAAATLLASVLAGCPSVDNSDTELSDQERIGSVLTDWKKFIELGGITRARESFAANFLHDGQGVVAVDAWLVRLASVPGLRVSVTDRRLSVQGDAADMDYLMQVESCTPADAGKPEMCEPRLRCRPGQGNDCEWFAHWRRLGDTWQVAGNQAKIGLEVASVDDGLGPHQFVVVHDPGHVATSAKLELPSPLDSIGLTPHGGVAWSLPSDTTPPTLPVDAVGYPFKVTVSVQTTAGTLLLSGSVMARTSQFRSVQQPGPNVALPFDFGWQLPTLLDGGTEVEVLDGDVTLWRSERTAATHTPYGGPPLNPGHTYGWRVIALDLYGNRARATGTVKVVPQQEVPPIPTLVVPATGKAKGGELIVLYGQSFSATTRVFVGARKCTGVEFVSNSELRCVTPTLEPGTYGIAMVNDANLAGWLDSAYTVQ